MVWFNHCLLLVIFLLITIETLVYDVTLATDSTTHDDKQQQKQSQQQQHQHTHQQHPQSSNKQYFNRGNIFLQISEPVNLSYTFKAKTSRIGVPFTETFYNIALVVAEPRDACKTIIDRMEIKNNIALVERGGCSFVEKCIEIERSGGVAMIVYDYDKHNDEHYIEMIDDTTSKNCSIPAVSLLGKDGHMIVQALLALRLTRAVITIPVNTEIAENRDNFTNPPWLMW